MRIGVVTAWPEEDWHSQRLLEACGSRCDALAIDPGDLSARVGVDGLAVRAAGLAIEGLDAFILARGLGRTGDPDVQFEIYRALEGTGAVVVNRLDALLCAQDKFGSSWRLSQAGVPTPLAVVAQTAGDAARALASLGEVVAKPLAGSLGEGVERLRSDGPGLRRAAERVARDGVVYLQAYVPHPGRDLRVFVVGGVARAAIVRHAPRGDWRTNVAGGGRAERVECTRSVRSTAEAAALALGLDYAGVDLVEAPGGPTVIEVNGTPSWQGILEATGLDMAEAIADHVLGRALRRRRGREHIERERTGATHG